MTPLEAFRAGTSLVTVAQFLFEVDRVNGEIAPSEYCVHATIFGVLLVNWAVTETSEAEGTDSVSFVQR